MQTSIKVKVALTLGIVIHLINLIAIFNVDKVPKEPEETTVDRRITERSISGNITGEKTENLPHLRKTLFPEFEHTDISRFYINVSKSHSLSVDRFIPDVRPEECRKVKVASASLPSVSVVIPMHNEPWSTLLRTIHSVINRSPPELLYEIIIIDDKSDLPFLGDSLHQYLEELSKNNINVSIVKSETRLGTMKSRNMGAGLAKGDVLVFLDSHTEVGVDWLEPLVWEIAKNRQTVVQPAVDAIDAMTLKYSKYMDNMRGEFKWTLDFIFEAIPPKMVLGKTSTDPILSPAIIGCCFAIDRMYYLDLGGLDEGMRTWGAEDVELSLRVWMCGGNMKVVECSRVGHVFKAGHPFKMPYEDLLYNQQRIAELWLGSYKWIFYAVHGGRVNPSNDFGDLSPIQTIQRNMNCKSFSWYLDNVFPEIHVPTASAVFFGTLKNSASGWCVGILGDDDAHFRFFSCSTNGPSIVTLTKWGLLKIKDKCVAAKDSYITLVPCAMDDVTQQWSYAEEEKQLAWHDGKSCMMHVTDPDPDEGYTQTVLLMPCNQKPDYIKFTQWDFSYRMSFKD